MTANAPAATPRTPSLDAAAGLTKLASYPFQILSWVDADGYPVSRPPLRAPSWVVSWLVSVAVEMPRSR